MQSKGADETRMMRMKCRFRALPGKEMSTGITADSFCAVPGTRERLKRKI